MSSAPENISSVLDGLLGPEGTMRMNAHKRALALWMRVNGDVERKHTCGAFVRTVAHADPALTIYLDSRTRVVDFTANRELYLRRLAYQGMPLSKLEFRLAKDIPARDAAEKEAAERAEELPELDAEELAYVESCVAPLEEPLRLKVSKAMIVSMRREKALQHRN